LPARRSLGAGGVIGIFCSDYICFEFTYCLIIACLPKPRRRQGI